MKRRQFVACVAVLLTSLHARARAQDLEIDAFDHGGLLTWTGTKLGSTCRVEWASALVGTGMPNWQTLTNVVATNQCAMSLPVPMLYRVIGVPCGAHIAGYTGDAEWQDKTMAEDGDWGTSAYALQSNKELLGSHPYNGSGTRYWRCKYTSSGSEWMSFSCWNYDSGSWSNVHSSAGYTNGAALTVPIPPGCLSASQPIRVRVYSCDPACKYFEGEIVRSPSEITGYGGDGDWHDMYFAGDGDWSTAAYASQSNRELLGDHLYDGAGARYWRFKYSSSGSEWMAFSCWNYESGAWSNVYTSAEYAVGVVAGVEIPSPCLSAGNPIRLRVYSCDPTCEYFEGEVVTSVGQLTWYAGDADWHDVHMAGDDNWNTSAYASRSNRGLTGQCPYDGFGPRYWRFKYSSSGSEWMGFSCWNYDSGAWTNVYSGAGYTSEQTVTREIPAACLSSGNPIRVRVWSCDPPARYYEGKILTSVPTRCK